MHEISIMYSILTMIEESAKENGIKKVSKIKLVIGTQRLVMPEALYFAFEQLKREPIEQDAVLEMEERIGRDLYIDYFEGE